MHVCTGLIPLVPITYNTIRSHMFRGVQPSNGGCINGASINGQATIDCGRGTALLDCRLNCSMDSVPDLSDMALFTWNKTASVSDQVSMVFKFDQQVNPLIIRLFFWMVPSDSVFIPNVRIYWSDDDSITPSNELMITCNIIRCDTNTTVGQHMMTIGRGIEELKFRYLRITMSFGDTSEWIFLSEVQFCGKQLYEYYCLLSLTGDDVCRHCSSLSHHSTSS